MSPTPRVQKDAGDDASLYTPKGCEEAYEKLEYCLAENNRDWRKCQAEVKALKECNQMERGVHVLWLYRHILRAAQRFPSIKRHQVIADIKQEFRDHKSLTEPEKIKKEIAVAQRSLEQLEAYTGLNQSGRDWEVSLKGPLD